MNDHYLQKGDSVGSCEVSIVEPRRLRLANSLIMSMLFVVVGIVTLIVDIVLIENHFNHHFLLVMPKMIGTFLLFVPPLSLFGLWFVGESFDFDAANDYIEHRQHYVRSKRYAVSAVQDIVLRVENTATDTWVRLKLRDKDGRELVTCCENNLFTPTWSEAFRLAGELALVLNKPIILEGPEPAQAFDAGKALIETVRATGAVPQGFAEF